MTTNYSHWLHNTLEDSHTTLNFDSLFDSDSDVLANYDYADEGIDVTTTSDNPNLQRYTYNF